MNIFIDCGTHLGEGLSEFQKKYNYFNNDSWLIYTFESNPEIDLNSVHTNVKNLTRIPKAVWIEDTQLTFSVQKSRDDKLRGVGSRLKFADKYMPKKEKEVTVDGVDFDRFINELKDYNKIVIKMDIEGAEFKVLRKLLSTGNIKKINTIYVETHERFFDDENSNTTNSLLNNIRKQGVAVYKWV